MSFEPFSQTEKGIYMNFEIRLTSISNFLEDCEKAFDKYILGELTQIGKAIDRGEYSNDYPKDNLLRGFNEAIHKEMVPYFVLSYVILVTSEFEKCIKKVCDKIKERYKLLTNIEDFKKKKGMGLIDAARKYLSDHGKFESPEIAHWNAIKDIYQIRNIIVHNDLEYEKLRKYQKEAVNRIVKKNCGIKKESDPFADFSSRDKNYKPLPTKIKIDWKFCEYTIKEVMTFFDNLKKEHFKRTFGSIAEVRTKAETKEK